MARIVAILRALRLTVSRDQRALLSLTGNPFFMASVVVLQDAGVFLYILLLIVLILPLSTDPSQAMPLSRIRSWPLSLRAYVVLRLACPWVNPMTWIVASLTLWVAFGKITFGFALLLGGFIMIGFFMPYFSVSIGGPICSKIPMIPIRYRELIRKEIRYIFTTLDFYVAGLLSASTVAVRMNELTIPPDGLMIITVLFVLTFSNYTQSLFGRDGSRGLSRYRLLPISGWEVLITKDIAIIFATLPLLGPLELGPGFSSILILMSFGHYISIRHPNFGKAWRFSPGTPFLYRGLLQIGVVSGTVAVVFLYGLSFLLLCLIVWSISIWLCGPLIDRR